MAAVAVVFVVVAIVVLGGGGVVVTVAVTLKISTSVEIYRLFVKRSWSDWPKAYKLGQTTFRLVSCLKQTRHTRQLMTFAGIENARKVWGICGVFFTHFI